MVKELHGDHKSLNWEQATFPFQMVQMADKWRLLTTYCTNCDDPSSPFRFPWFRTLTPLQRKALIAMAHLRKTGGKHGKGVSLIEADMPLGMPREVKEVLSMGSPGVHNGLFGLALNSLEPENHRKFAEEKIS